MHRVHSGKLRARPPPLVESAISAHGVHILDNEQHVVGEEGIELIMLQKGFDELTVDDLRSLVADRVSENRRLEFKLQLYGGTERNHAEAAADLSAMANGAGGPADWEINPEFEAEVRAIYEQGQAGA